AYSGGDTGGRAKAEGRLDQRGSISAGAEPNSHLTRKEAKLLRQIQQALSFDLLNGNLREDIAPTEHYTRGHCYVASEAFYYLHGKRAGYDPRGRDYHWWLEHRDTGAIVDPTLPQLDGPF